MTTFNENSIGLEPIFPLLLGNGKLARHLHHYFHLIHFPHKHFENARRLHDPELHRKIREVNAIWILTSDQSIQSVFESLSHELSAIGLDPENYIWIHSSAATQVNQMHTIHPLMTFGRELYSKEVYENIPLAFISGDAESLMEQIPIPNPKFQIFSAQRALYHAYAVLMSNLPILLWSLTTEECKKRLALPAQTFDPILKQTLQNFLNDRGSALTGPIARNDQATIEKNIKALGASPLKEIYQSFLNAYLGEKNDQNS